MVGLKWKRESSQGRQGVGAELGVTWDASEVQWLLGVGRREGVPPGCVAAVCVQFQVQDVLLYGDWREGKLVRWDLGSPAR